MPTAAAPNPQCQPTLSPSVPAISGERNAPMLMPM